MIIIIPARSGSKRIKGKNVRNLGGIPLVAWSIATAKGIASVDRVLLSTDSPEYLSLASSYGIEGIPRTPGACSDKATDYDVILDVIAREGITDGLLIYLRPTTPYRSISVVEEAIRVVASSGEKVDSLRSVQEMRESAYKSFRLKGEYLDPMFGNMIESNLPNQMLPKTYEGNGYVDIVKPEYILKHGDLWGRCMGYETPWVVEIDTERDFEYAEYLLEKEI